MPSMEGEIPQVAAARVSLALGAADIVGVWDGDLVAGTIYGDANFARIYGVDPAVTAQGVPLGGYMQNIHPDDADDVRNAVQRLYAGGLEFASEHRIFRPNGEMRWVMSRGRLARNAEGIAIRFAGVSVDITDRKQSEARHAFLLKLTDQLLAVVDPRDIVGVAATSLGLHLGASRVGFGVVQEDDATIVLETSYVNGVAPIEGAYLMSHFGEPTVARHRLGLTVVHEDLDALSSNYDGAFVGSTIRSFVSVPLVREGRLRANLFVSYRDPHVWEAEDVALIESVAGRLWDAIERARAETALRQLNASLESQIEARIRERERNWRLAPVLMVIADSNGVLREINPAWTRTLGWTAEETIGHPLTQFLTPEDRAVGAATLEQLLRGAAPVECQLTLRAKGAEQRRIAWTTVPEGECVYGYGRDITDQLVAEDRLRQAQKMEAVGQLTGGLAHDFNNLLAGITGCLELLQSRLLDGRHADAERYITAAQGDARRAAVLTNRLLAFSRRQTLAPKATNVNTLVAGMEELIRRSVGPGFSIDVALDPDIWMTLVDPHQLENALLNLTINARDAMAGGGRMTVVTSNQEVAAALAREHDLRPGQYVVLSVKDTGTGMTPEVLRRAFDPFFTTKPLGLGTGLGLSMIYGFSRQSGGHVRIESALGDGTSVYLYLPRYLGPAEVGGTDAPCSIRSAAEQSATVLVVDDEPTVRMLVVETLADLGFETIEAEDGAQGLKLLESRTSIDLLVTDVGLPGGLNGRQLADAGRVLHPAMRILFITGYAQESFTGLKEMAPGMQLLTKPFALEVLTERVERLMAETRQISLTHSIGPPRL